MTNLLTALKLLDFASGQKTITGLAIYFLPVLTTSLGVDIGADEVTQLIANWFQIFGAALALYGLVVKGIRGVKNLVRKFQ